MLFGKENGKGRAAEARTQGYPISDRPCLRDVLVTVGHQPVRREGSAPEGVTFPRIVGTAHLTMAAMATLPIMNAQRGTWDSGKERDRGPPALEKETVAFQPEIERERDRGPPARERQRGTVLDRADGLLARAISHCRNRS